MSHYYTSNPDVQSDEKLIEYTYEGYKFKFYTDSGVFSRSAVDFGSRTLIEGLPSLANKKCLEVGVGYGPISIITSKINNISVDAIDVNNRAIDLAKKNSKLNGVSLKIWESDMFSNVNEKYDVIISNPPIRIGKIKLFEMYSSAYENLSAGGELYLVIQKKQGSESTIKYLKTLFQEVDVVYKSKGYFVIKSVK